MPIKECSMDGKPGFKYGDDGKCYTYEPDDDDSRTRAKRRAETQMRAIKFSQSKS